MARKKSAPVIPVEDLIVRYLQLSPAEQNELRDDLAVALINSGDAYDLDEAYELTDDPAQMVKQVWSLQNDYDVDEETVAAFLAGRPNLHAVGFDHEEPRWVNQQKYVPGKGWVDDPDTQVDGAWVEGFWIGPSGYEAEDLVYTANRIVLLEHLNGFPFLADDWRQSGGQLQFKISEDEPDAEVHRPSLIFLILYNFFAGLEDYPLADDELHSLLEMEDTTANLADTADRLIRDDWRLLYPEQQESYKLEYADEAGYAWPHSDVPGWVGPLYDAMSEENDQWMDTDYRDGRGAYPDDELLHRGLTLTKLYNLEEATDRELVVPVNDELNEQEQVALRYDEVRRAVKRAVPAIYVDEVDASYLYAYPDDLPEVIRVVREHAYPGQTKLFD